LGLARKGEEFPPFWRGGKIHRLRKSIYLDEETYEILIRLRMLLDSAARGAEEVDYAGAIEYSQLARRMIERLNSIEL